MVRNGSPQRLRAQGTGRSAITQSQLGSAGFDEMPVRGADRIAIDAARGNLMPPTALDGVVETDHHRPRRQKVADDHPEQLAGDGALLQRARLST